MASTPPINEQFLKEVDDELRRERALSLWQRWGRTALIAVVVALAAFGGYLYWRSTQVAAAGVEAEKLSQALDKLVAGNGKTVKPDLEALAKSDGDAMRAAAKLTLAAMAVQNNDDRGAAAQYGAIATDATLPKPYRDLALVRQSAAEFDLVKPEVIVRRLGGLAQPGNPWFGSAGELVGMAYIKMGKRADAARLFSTIAGDKSVPETISSRVRQIAEILGADANARAGAPAAGAPQAKDKQ